MLKARITPPEGVNQIAIQKLSKLDYFFLNSNNPNKTAKTAYNAMVNQINAFGPPPITSNMDTTRPDKHTANPP